MINSELIIKSYVLLYLENSSDVQVTDSRELVKQALKKITSKGLNKNYIANADRDPSEKLLDHINNIINSDETNLTYEYVISTIKLLYRDDDIVNSVKYMINPDNPPETNKAQILNIRSYLSTIIQKDTAKNAVSSAYRQLMSNDPANTESVSTVVQTLVSKLETISAASKADDPAIITKLSFEDKNSVYKTVEDALDEQIGGKILKLGSYGLNQMTQGGIRLGTFTAINALQHGFKSSFGRMLFAQIATSNDAFVSDTSKKPLLLYISFEDALHYTTNFLYEYLLYTNERKRPDFSKTDAGYITDYLYDHLTARGWYIEMIRVNPSEWTYRSILNKILEYEVEGYEVVLVVTDYLSKLPTTGCDKSGAMGTDVQDMFRKVGNFVRSKNIAFVTPHQLSTEAKGLWASGLKGHDLLDAIVGGGYTAKSKQLDVEIDLEIYLAIEKRGDKYYLCVQRGKHRGMPIIPERQKRWIFPFPNLSPIPADPSPDKHIGSYDYSSLNDDSVLDLV